MTARARRLRIAASALLWVLVWELADRLISNGLLLAGPVRTIAALGAQLDRPEFWGIAGSSLGRIAMGFFAAVLGGVALATIAHRHRWFEDLIAPIVSVVKSIPVVSFIVMLLIWFGGRAFTSWLAFLIVIPLIYTSMLAGLAAVPVGDLERAQLFRVTALRRYWYLSRPAFMPHLRSACKVGVGMSWRAGIMAEVFATTTGSIGREMFTAKTFLDTPTLFAWTVVVMLLSLLFERLVLLGLDYLARPCGSLLGRAGAPVPPGKPSAGSANQSGAGANEIRIRGVAKRFGLHEVLNNVELTLARRSVTCLRAASGAGKTTLLRVVAGLELPDAGGITGIRPGSVSMMFQEDRLCEALTAVENVAFVLPRLRGRGRTRSGGRTRTSIRRELGEILPDQGLDRPVRELSGGMRRRVSLACALLYPSDVLLLDEPFTGLDSDTRERVARFIRRRIPERIVLAASHGEHDPKLLGAEEIALVSTSTRVPREETA